jgi:hypothetical protein
VLKFLPLASFHTYNCDYPVSGPKMAFLDPMDLEFGNGDDPSITMGTKTLAANALIPE